MNKNERRELMEGQRRAFSFYPGKKHQWLARTT
jgi:hypothetical protein